MIFLKLVCTVKLVMKNLLVVLLLTVCMHAQASELKIYVAPSEGVDWSTPSKLAKSLLKSQVTFKKRPLGKVYVELNCGNGEELYIQESESLNFIKQFFLTQKGLGFLFYSFPGKLIKMQEKLPWPFLRFIINDKQCARATNYIHDYDSKKVGRHFGLSLRPRFGEGASSASFAISVLEVLDIMSQETKEAWTRTLYLPPDLLGPPVTEKAVSIFKMLRASSWSKHQDPNFTFTFLDPDLMYQWMKENPGKVIDRSHIPVPESPIWLQHLNPDLKK